MWPVARYSSDGRPGPALQVAVDGTGRGRAVAGQVDVQISTPNGTAGPEPAAAGSMKEPQPAPQADSILKVLDNR
jgi:hypothetical protein